MVKPRPTSIREFWRRGLGFHLGVFLSSVLVAVTHQAAALAFIIALYLNAVSVWETDGIKRSPKLKRWTFLIWLPALACGGIVFLAPGTEWLMIMPLVVSSYVLYHALFPGHFKSKKERAAMLQQAREGYKL